METKDKTEITRRRLLARLGLASGVAYVAPAMTHLGAAHASGASRGSRGSGASGRGYRYDRSDRYGRYDRGSGVSGRGSYGSGPSGRGRRDRGRSERVVDGVLRTLDGLGVLR